MSKKASKAEERVEGVEHALTSAEQFLETYQKPIVITIGALVGVVVLYMAFHYFFVTQKTDEAAAQMFPAEQYFEKESWDLALDGDGNNLGFIDIIGEYGFTPSANLARYYAGMCYWNQGQYDDAIKYLKKFKSKDKVLSNLALGTMGDAYAEQGETDKAISQYIKAADHNKNDFTSPLYLLRAGILYEKVNKNDDALKIYSRIKKEYSASTEGRSIDKYISRVTVKIGK